MHDVACEFARAAVRSKDAQKQLSRTSLRLKNMVQHIFLEKKKKKASTIFKIYL